MCAQEDKGKSTPKWLVEFNSYATKKEDNTNNNNVARPLTENVLLNRPKWFEDLTGSNQKRRMSEFAAGTNLLPLAVQPQRENKTICNESHSSTIHERSVPHHHDGDDDSDTDFGDRSKFHFNLTSDTDKLDVSRNSSSNDSKASSVLNDSIEEDLLNFKPFHDCRLSEMNSIDELIIPEMPAGTQLVLTLIDNWGDELYLGLNGIEILDPCGKRPAIRNISLLDANHTSLPDAHLHKLFDKCNRTQDDTHIWQCRLHHSQTALPLRIVIQFDKLTTLALLRIWNHNQSRIHSYRGVKTLSIHFDGHLIFHGEIARAEGDLVASLEHFGDTILFTTDDNILETISQHDVSFKQLLLEQINTGML